MTILDVLALWATSQPNKAAWNYLDDKGNVSETYTYQELDQASSYLAQNLLTQHSALSPGDRVLLVFFPSLSFTISLLACFKCGLVAVPVFPPDPRRLKKDLHHFVSIQKNSNARVVLTHNLYNHSKKLSELSNIFASFVGSGSAEKWPDMKWIVVDEILAKGKALKPSATNQRSPLTNKPGDKQKPNNSFVPVNISDIAFLQYTSGSTSEPKGVMISHENLLHNLKLIVKELNADQNTINVSWLPQYHDMGLIGSYLGLLYCGGTGYYLSPISFLKDPVCWIRALSTYHGTHTQAPNFAFALAVRKFKEFLSSEKSKQVSLDLSSVKHMINAAEPVDSSVVINFNQTFSPYNLPSNVLKPTYGLAEHTVFVCSGGSQIVTVSKASLEFGKVEILSTGTIAALSSDTSTAAATDILCQEIVGCGYPFLGENVDLIIVDPETLQPLPGDRVGEIWVDSPSKAQGYWNQPELTKEDFLARPTGVESPRAYLRTGDLGFLFNDELFICGRRKDLIIVRGSNHYPQDIERTGERATDGLRAGCSAAFALKRNTDETEIVVYVAEVRT